MENDNLKTEKSKWVFGIYTDLKLKGKISDFLFQKKNELPKELSIHYELLHYSNFLQGLDTAFYGLMLIDCQWKNNKKPNHPRNHNHSEVFKNLSSGRKNKFINVFGSESNCLDLLYKFSNDYEISRYFYQRLSKNEKGNNEFTLLTKPNDVKKFINLIQSELWDWMKENGTDTTIEFFSQNPL